MTDSLFSRFVKTANYYVGDEFITCVAAAGILVSEQPYANQIIKASLFATSPIVSVGSNLYQMTKTGVSLGSMAAALVDTTIRGYALPFAARASAQMISNITGLNAELLNIPAQIGSQALYTKAKNYLVNEVTDKNGNTALTIAAKRGDIETIKALIQAGADSKSALSRAARKENWAMVNNLIHAGANPNITVNDNNDTLLIDTVRKGKIDTFLNLIKAGVEIDTINNQGYTALAIAILENQPVMVEYLIQTGANLNRQDDHGDTMLIQAVINGDTSMTKALIKTGANLDLQSKYGDNALIWAAHKGHTSIANSLIQAGANLNLQNQYGNTALIGATFKDHPAIANSLIQAGANLNLQNKDGNTALICAAYEGHTAITNALSQASADITLINNASENALTIANRKSKDEVTFSILSAMKLPEITAAIQYYPQLNQVVNRFKETVLHVKDNMFQTLRALVQNAPMKGDDFSANLVNLPLEIKTVILSHMNYPVWYARKERDLSVQSYHVAKMIEDRQASDAKKILHQIEQRRILTNIKGC